MCCALLGTSIARADASEPAEATDPAPRREWYGAPVIAADATAFSLLILAGAAYPNDEHPMKEVVQQAGVITYFGGGPVVHWLHGRTGTGFASLGLRFGVPLGGALLGAGLGFAIDPSDEGSETAAEGSLIGFGLGMFAMPAIDAAVLAWRPVVAEPGGVLILPHVARDAAGVTLVQAW
jgi:hypothetical protein